MQYLTSNCNHHINTASTRSGPRTFPLQELQQLLHADPGETKLYTDQEVQQLAASIREDLAAHMPTVVCAICSRLCCSKDVLLRDWQDVPNKQLLLAVPTSLTTTTIHGSLYAIRSTAAAGCFHRGTQQLQLQACKECWQHLQQQQVPYWSLQRFDPGDRPPHLPPLTYLENLCLAAARPHKVHIVCQPTSGRTRPQDTLQVRFD